MNKIFILLFLMIVMFAGVIAPPPTFTSFSADKTILIETAQGTYIRNGQNYTFHIHPLNSSNGKSLTNDTTWCIIHVYNASTSGKHIVKANMSFDISNLLDFEYYVIGNNFSMDGEYTVVYYCEVYPEFEANRGGAVGTFIEVLSNENPVSLYDLLARIFLICFFCSLMFILYWATHKINFEQWSKKVMRKYETTNFIKFIFSAMLYHLMKESFIIYYLLGLPIMMILANITYAYNIVGFTTFMNSLLLVYTVGIVLVGLVFLSYVQEWAMVMIGMLKDENWGIGNDK